MSVKKWHFVYQTMNLMDGKIYVGVHTSYVDPEKKFDGYLGRGILLMDAIALHGRENFKRTVIRICDSKEEAILLEKEIVTKEFIASGNTYNIASGGAGCVAHTEEAKAVMSEVRVGAGNSMYGRKHSDDSKKIMSAIRIGKPLSSETRLRMSIAHQNSTVIRKALPTEPCPHCGSEQTRANMSRWHGDNCRVLLNQKTIN
jgi:group I intron endonuclease